MRDQAYRDVLAEKRELQAMFDREIAARRMAQDCESNVQIKLEDEKDASEDSHALIGQLRTELAALQSKLDAANLRSHDQTRQNQDLLEQLSVEQEAHTQTQDQLAILRGELETTQALYKAAQEEVSAALAQIGKEEDKSWMFRLVRDQVAGIISKLNRGLRLEDSQHASHRAPSAVATSVRQTPLSSNTAAVMAGGVDAGSGQRGVTVTNTTDPGAKYQMQHEEPAVRFDFEVSTDDRGVRTIGAPVAVRTAARRPKNFGHSAQLVEVERAAILQELIDLYELTASSATDSDSRENLDNGDGIPDGIPPSLQETGGNCAGSSGLHRPEADSERPQTDSEVIDEERFQKRKAAGLDYFKLDTAKVADELHSLVESAHFSTVESPPADDCTGSEPNESIQLEHAHLHKADALAIGHFVHEAKEAYQHADEVCEEKSDGCAAGMENEIIWSPEEDHEAVSKAAIQIQSAQRGNAIRKQLQSPRPDRKDTSVLHKVEVPFSPEEAIATELTDELLNDTLN
eukprot:SAG31_NODE_4894_length_2880_cov_1.838907_2_plen_517_part_00